MTHVLVEEKQEAFAQTLPEKTLIELCLAHDKEMRWGYLSRRDYVFIEISEELKRRGEDLWSAEKRRSTPAD